MKQRFAGKNPKSRLRRLVRRTDFNGVRELGYFIAKTNYRTLAVLAIAFLPFLSGCGGGSKSSPEATLAVTTTPAVNTTLAPALGPFNLNVKITSAMPAKGVTIAVTAAPDGTSNNFFSKSVSTTTASNDFSITGTPVGVVSVVNITVTSNSTSTNTWSGSYRYSAK
ncbi:MAG TPA: hypothetical protein VHD83_03115 [Puia sp.]|nr:hypothetical protein [Puia sp.]